MTHLHSLLRISPVDDHQACLRWADHVLVTLTVIVSPVELPIQVDEQLCGGIMKSDRRYI